MAAVLSLPVLSLFLQPASPTTETAASIAQSKITRKAVFLLLTFLISITPLHKVKYCPLPAPAASLKNEREAFSRIRVFRLRRTLFRPSQLHANDLSRICGIRLEKRLLKPPHGDGLVREFHPVPLIRTRLYQKASACSIKTEAFLEHYLN